MVQFGITGYEINEDFSPCLIEFKNMIVLAGHKSGEHTILSIL